MKIIKKFLIYFFSKSSIISIIIANYYHLTLGGQVMKFKISKLLIPLITTSLLFIGCSNNTNSNKTTDDDTLNIVTSFYPLYISTINITKDIPNVSVTNMTKSQTGCLHD